VYDLVILKGAADMKDAIHGLDVREESVSKASALSRTLDEAGNVCDREHGRNDALGLVLLH